MTPTSSKYLPPHDPRHEITKPVVLPGCKKWKACIRRGGSLRNEKKWPV